MFRPWIIIRVFLRALLAYLALFLLWVVLPSPNPESSSDDGTGYSTSVLRAGKTLTRVYHRYFSSQYFLPSAKANFLVMNIVASHTTGVMASATASRSTIRLT